MGVSSFPADATPYVQFAISTNRRWSNAVENEFDIVVDTTGDGAPDYVVRVADEGLISSGVVNGTAVVAVCPWDWDGVTPPSIVSYAYAPTDSSTILAPVLFDQLGLSAANPRFTYWVEAYSLTTNGFDISDTKVSFNAIAPSVSTGMYDVIAPGGSATEKLTVDAAELARTSALGWMVVSPENPRTGPARRLRGGPAG